MEVSTHSTIHKRFKNFVAWIAPEESKEDAVRRQGEELKSRIRAKATENSLQVEKVVFSGSFAKRTGLRRFYRGGAEVDGQDVDIAFILKPKDTGGKELGCQIHNFKRWLRESYPNSEIGNTKSSATIGFLGTRLHYDLVPLISTNKAHIQKLIRTDDEERQSSVEMHVEFVRNRNASSNAIQGVVKYNQCLRLMKWWKHEGQSSSGIFGNGDDGKKVPSFLLDLLCAKAYDEFSVRKTYPETLAVWFGYLADVVRNRKPITFTDFGGTKPVQGTAKWLVADPVDPTNNVVKNWQNDRINELANWFETARSKIIQAIRKDGDGDDSGSMESLVALFGTAFKNNA